MHDFKAGDRVVVLTDRYGKAKMVSGTIEFIEPPNMSPPLSLVRIDDGTLLEVYVEDLRKITTTFA